MLATYLFMRFSEKFRKYLRRRGVRQQPPEAVLEIYKQSDNQL